MIRCPFCQSSCQNYIDKKICLNKHQAHHCSQCSYLKYTEYPSGDEIMEMSFAKDYLYFQCRNNVLSVNDGQLLLFNEPIPIAQFASYCRRIYYLQSLL